MPNDPDGTVRDARASLRGVRVLDLSRLLPGPYATRLLADLGASVDKLEPLGAGDAARHVPPFEDDGSSVLFRHLHHGKRSVALDLKRPEGVEVLRSLVAGYDIVVESFRPGVMARLGAGIETLRALYPKLILCSITGYGQEGPRASRAGHDINYLARSGVLGLTGPAEEPPQLPGGQIADIGGALHAVIAILAALRSRDLYGEGAALDLSLTDAATSFALFGLLTRLGGSRPARGEDALMGGLAPYRVYLSSDGHPVAIGALEPKFWFEFCGAVGIEPDPAALRPGTHQKQWRERLSSLFAGRTRAQWEAFSVTHDCCLEVVSSPEEVLAEAHAEPSRGSLAKLLGTAAATRAPELGADTDAILLEAGYDEDSIRDLRARQIIA